MNAVLTPVPTSESPALAALHAYRERRRAIEAEAAPLRARITAMQSSVCDAEAEEAAAHAKRDAALAEFNAAVADAPDGAHRDLFERHRLASVEAERLSLHTSALKRAAQTLTADLHAIEARIHQEPRPLLALQYDLACEGMTEVVEERNRIKARLYAIDRELDARAAAADTLARDCLHAHGIPLQFLMAGLRELRMLERDTARNAELVGTPRPEVTARAAEIRREIEAA